MTLLLPLPLAMLFNSPSYAPLCCTFVSLDYVTFFVHPYYFCLFLITSCLLFSSIWYLFFPHLLHCTYITITFSMHHPNSSRYTFSGTLLPQCFFALLLNSATELLYSCCASYGLATHATPPSFVLLILLSYAFPFTECVGLSFCYTFCGFTIHITLFFSHNRHSLHLCPFFPHLKHLTSATPTFLIIFSSTPHCITLLFNALNLFWGIVVPFFFVSTITDQMPKPLAELTQLSSSSF